MSSKPGRPAGARGIYSLVRNELRFLGGETWFRAGLALRLVLVAVFVPVVQEQWFLPFLRQFLTSLDPYAGWLSAGGDPVAWPYGPAMSLAHLPTMLAGLFGAPTWPLHVVFGLTLVAADMATVVCLRRLGPEDAPSLAARIWWLSPAGLVISYWHGQTDVVPIAFLMAALLAFHIRRWSVGGVAAGLSVAAKLTMGTAPLFFAVWLGLSRRLAGKLRLVFVPLAAIAGLGYLAVLIFPGSRQMILGNPVVGQASGAAIRFGHTQVMILPALLVVLLYVVARARRLGFNLMVGILGTALFVMAAVLAIAPGWWLAALPFLGLYAARSDRTKVALGVWAFSALLGLQTILHASGSRPVLGSLPDIRVPDSIQSLSLTLVIAVGLVLAISMFRHALADNDPYALATRPLLIGISGPSGSGKDTLSRALAGVFGEGEIVAVSGDDYHKWERGAPMWRVWTHFNPAANELSRMTEDVLALTAGKSIQCRYYDHATGRFEPRRSKQHNNVVLVSGLHALYGPELRGILDVRIYLAMDDGLLRFLKLGRDTTERHHAPDEVLKNMARREPDLRKYIDPQIAFADLIFRLEPRDAADLDRVSYGAPLPLRLVARIRSGVRVEELQRLLVAFCWCAADVERVDGSGETLLVLEEEEISREDVAEMAGLLVPNHDELLALAPTFLPGLSGVMQLLVLMHIGVVRHQSARGIRT